MNHPPPNIRKNPALQRILAVLEQSGGLSREEIAHAACIGAGTLSGSGYLALLKAAQLIHVSGWSRNGNGFTTPLYDIGEGPDFPQPHFDPERRCGTGYLARIMLMLQKHGPLTYSEAAIATGLPPNTVKSGRYIYIPVAESRTEVRSWRHSRRSPACAVYAAGQGHILTPSTTPEAQPDTAHPFRPQDETGVLPRTFNDE